MMLLTLRRFSLRSLLPLCSLLVVAACGPGALDSGTRDGGGGPGAIDGGRLPNSPDADPASYAAISGKVYAPGHGPGQVAAGYEVPVFGALVSISLTPPPAIPQEVYCDQCVDPPGAHVLTGHDGSFTLTPILPGTYWLVIQKGQFRIDQQALVGPGERITLPPNATTLPSRHDPASGLWVPRIALAHGLWDKMEDIVGKMRIGSVDGSGVFVGSSAAGNFDLYQWGSGDHPANSIGELESLVGDLARMRQYHIIFIPCSNGDDSALFGNQSVRDNIREYVRLGGKFYVTDWSSEWEDVVFPEFIQFSSDHDTPAGATPASFSDGNGFPGYESEDARAEDADLNAWLNGQRGPLVDGFGSYRDGVANSNDFVVEGAWNHIEATPTIQIGVDDEGLPVSETAKAWVKGDWTPGEGPIHPLTVTFEPQGCGRVLYSSYHTADTAHVGLVPQEKVLLYLIMEIGVCKSGPIIE